VGTAVATARANADLAAPVAAVYAVVANPARLPEWDVTYDAVTPRQAEPGEEPTFEAHRVLADRAMRLVCRVVEEESPNRFAFACGGDAGEQVGEEFLLADGSDGAGTRLTRQADFDFGNVDPLGVVPEQIYLQAWLDRSVEQAFGRLGVLLGAGGGEAGPAVAGPASPPALAAAPPVAPPPPVAASADADRLPPAPPEDAVVDISPEAVGQGRWPPEGGKQGGVFDFVKIEFEVFLVAVVVALVFLAIIVVFAVR